MQLWDNSFNLQFTHITEVQQLFTNYIHELQHYYSLYVLWYYVVVFLFLHAITEFASQASRVGIWFSERSYVVKKQRGDFNLFSNFLNLSLSLSPSLSMSWCTDWEWRDSFEFSANAEVESRDVTWTIRHSFSVSRRGRLRVLLVFRVFPYRLEDLKAVAPAHCDKGD